MADIKSIEERSRNMAAIKNKDTKPEIFLRKLLFSEGFRYRKNYNKLPGHPDVWLKKYNTAIFVNGCFWHRHKNCKYAYMPKSRQEFWNNKFENNVQRDSAIYKLLLSANIKIIIIWECTIRKAKRNEEAKKELLKQIITSLEAKELYVEI